MYKNKNISDLIKNRELNLNKILNLFKKTRKVNVNDKIRCDLNTRDFFYDAFNECLKYTITNYRNVRLNDILFICFPIETFSDNFFFNCNLNLIYKIFKNNKLCEDKRYPSIMCNKKCFEENLFRLLRGNPYNLYQRDTFSYLEFMNIIKKNKLNFKDEIILNKNVFIALICRNDGKFDCILGNETMKSFIFKACRRHKGILNEKDFNIINAKNLLEYKYLNNNAFYLYKNIYEQLYTYDEIKNEMKKYLNKIKYIECINKIFNFPYRKNWMNKLLYNSKYLKENGKYVVLD